MLCRDLRLKIFQNTKAHYDDRSFHCCSKPCYAVHSPPMHYIIPTPALHEKIIQILPVPHAHHTLLTF